LSPKYLDQKGLTSLWRETLLAKKVLEGKTKGYRNHPQLNRFKNTPNPDDCINFYLKHIWEEAHNRGYNFDNTKFSPIEEINKIPVTRRQIEFESLHLLNKLKKRDPLRYKKFGNMVEIEVHPLFYLTEGDIEAWEKLD